MAKPFAYIPRLSPGRYRIDPESVTEFSQPFESRYFDAAGQMVTAPPNTPRFENGELIIERASRNLFAVPDELDSARWEKTGDYRINDPQTVAPDGTNTTIRVGNGAMALSQALPLMPGFNYSTSVWAYYPQGPGASITFTDGVSVTALTFSPAPGWQRLKFDAYVQVRSNTALTFNVPERDAPVWLWWPQLEVGYMTLTGPDADVRAAGGSWDFIGPNISRVGLTISPEGASDAVVYQSGSLGNSFVGRQIKLTPGERYRFSVWTKLVSGPAPAHWACLLVDSRNDLDPASAEMLPMVTAKPPTATWAEQVMVFTAGDAVDLSFAYFAVDWESTAKIAFWRPMLVSLKNVGVTSTIRGERGNDVAYLAEYTKLHTPDMEPLRRSHEADSVESELKALFLEMFETFARPGERQINTVGIPHIGPLQQVERAVSSEGLDLQRRGNEDVMRYVFRSWRARNPKRGLHMLRAYLQLLWPNGWEMTQQWSKNGQPYTEALSDTDDGNSFLTSRVHVFVNTATSDGSDVASIAPSLRSVVPARIVLRVQVITRDQIDMSLAMGGVGSTFQTFTGTIS